MSADSWFGAAARLLPRRTDFIRGQCHTTAVTRLSLPAWKT